MLEKFTLYQFENSYQIEKSKDGKYIANLNHEVSIFDSKTMQLINCFKDLDNPSTMSFSNNSEYLAVKNTLGKIILYNLNKMKRVKVINQSKVCGAELFFTPDDKYIISGDWDGKIYSYDIKRRKNIVIKEYPGYMVREIKYDRFSSKYIFLISEIEVIGDKRREDEYNNIILEWEYPFEKNRIIEKKVDKFIYKFCYNNYYNSYVTVNRDKLVVYNSEFEIVKSREIKKSSIYASLDWSTDGKYILFINDEYFKIIDYEKFSVIKSFKTEHSKFARFVDADDEKNVFLGSLFSKGCYLDFSKLINKKID